MKQFTLKMAFVALLAFGYTGTAISTQALADNGHGRGHAKHQKDDDRDDHDRRDNLATIIIGSHDRDEIRNYLQQDYQRHCPPGLAKKHNGCLPPGQAKKYRLGHSLPKGVNYQPLPDSLLGLLSQPPEGYHYAKVDNDVVLMSEAGKKIIDAVTLISAVGK